MNQTTRRDFLQTTAGLLALGLAGTGFDFKKNTPRLCFTTLGTPDWTFAEIVRFARENQFEGLELRGILRELDLTKCKEFNSPESIKATRKLMEDNRLKFAGLGASANLHSPAGAERTKNLDEAKRFIDLAIQIGCPAVRVFPNNFLKEQGPEKTMELIAKGLSELGDYAKAGKIKVLLETHGDLVKSDDVVKVMQMAQNSQIGLVWDVVNMWSVTKEPPAVVYPKIAKYIHHTHIKDEMTVDGKIKYTMMGKGEAPIFDAIKILIDGGYNGFYSFEWEKLWHPEIDAPEIALPHFVKVMKERY
jgi:sugar phosphate isomerase/epimerase